MACRNLHEGPLARAQFLDFQGVSSTVSGTGEKSAGESILEAKRGMGSFRIECRGQPKNSHEEKNTQAKVPALSRDSD
jgi:hypothetical protein